MDRRLHDARVIAAVLVAAATASCGRVRYQEVGGLDGGAARDATIADARTPEDAGDVDAHGIDGGEPDGAPPDAPETDAGPPVFCGGPPVLFCDDFEGATVVPPWTGVYAETGGVVRLDDVTVHAGGGALYAEQPSPGASAYAAASLPPRTSGEIYVRQYVYVPVGASTEHVDPLVVSSSEGGIALQDSNTRVTLYGSFGVPGQLAAPDVVFPEDRWVCVEMRIGIDPTAGSVSVWLDGVLAADVTSVTTVETSPLDTLMVGVQYVSSRQPAGAWVAVDDVVVSTARIGC